MLVEELAKVVEQVMLQQPILVVVEGEAYGRLLAAMGALVL